MKLAVEYQRSTRTTNEEIVELIPAPLQASSIRRLRGGKSHPASEATEGS